MRSTISRNVVATGHHDETHNGNRYHYANSKCSIPQVQNLCDWHQARWIASNLVMDEIGPNGILLLTRTHDTSDNTDHRKQRVFREITRNISAKIGSEAAIKTIDKIKHPHSAIKFSQRTTIRIQREYSRGICDDKRSSRPRSSDCFRYANTILLILVLGQHLRRLRRIHRQRVLIDAHGDSLIHGHVD